MTVCVCLQASKTDRDRNEYEGSVEPNGRLTHTTEQQIHGSREPEGALKIRMIFVSYFTAGVLIRLF